MEVEETAETVVPEASSSAKAEKPVKLEATALTTTKHVSPESTAEQEPKVAEKGSEAEVKEKPVESQPAKAAPKETPTDERSESDRSWSAGLPKGVGHFTFQGCPLKAQKHL